MAETERHLRRLRFENFEVDLRSGELRKAGVKLKFGGQPLQVLTILLEQPGEVVTREELQKRLWPDTFVDVDHNLNTAINKIREVLGDSTESPRYVETLPRRGYRFIAPVNGGVLSSDPPVEKVPPARSKVWEKPRYYGLAILSALVIMIGVRALWKRASRPPSAPRVVRFIKLTNDGQVKSGPLTTDGSRIYFTEIIPNGHTRIAQVSVNGGEVVPLSAPFNRPEVFDLSKDGTDLLIGNFESDEMRYSLWLLPVAGGSPRRVGTVFVQWASFGADGASIICSHNFHDIFSVRRDGSAFQKLLTVEGNPYAFRFSPDGNIFRFTQADPQYHSSTIMEARADGTGLRRLFLGHWADGLLTDGFSYFRTVSKADLIYGPCPHREARHGRRKRAGQLS
jgi:DNA-binding winged helix-turn-helix (wHTH) protein